MWKAIVAALVIFSAGVMTGGLLVWRTSNHPAPPPSRQLVVNASPVQTQLRAFLARIDRELTLTPEQRQRIERIITERQKRTKDLWEPVAEQMRDELKEAREEIRGVLTQQQKKKFEELVKTRPPRKPEATPPPPERRPREERRSVAPTNSSPGGTNRI